MKRVDTLGRVPIKLWLDDIEPEAVEQAINLSNLPFAFKHIAIMPDSHTGYGMPIGSVLATNGVIIPNAVGVDIGCGMCAVKTNLKDVSKDDLKQVINKAYELIPVGNNWHKESQEDSDFMTYPPTVEKIVAKNYEKAKYQLGTLGGGNHFIEVQKGSDGHIWVMIHSGSRNLGFNVAKHYNKVAIETNKKYYSSVDEKVQLAFLPINSEDGKDYYTEMHYCVAFARQNRFLMLERMRIAFNTVLKTYFINDIINESHNFAAWENHFNKNVIVHRKGATRAYKGELGIIPGSQGTKSYIVKGLGNPESFRSCSHGAGRVMSRRQARKTLDLNKEKELMNGVIHNMTSSINLDEAPSAYKDIDVVMENQKDLVEIVVELKPLAVIKG